MVLKAGERRHTVTFQKKQLVSGKYGKNEIFVSFLTVRAKVTQPQSLESDSEHGKTYKRKLVIFMRFKATVSETARLLYGGDEYNITRCRDVKGTRRELVIDAEKRS